MRIDLTKEQTDHIHEITERYSQLFIREYQRINKNDELVCLNLIHELIQFVTTGTTIVLQDYLREVKLFRTYYPDVRILVNNKTHEIRFDVNLVHRPNPNCVIEMMSRIANA